jgi:hypothetical protein
MRPDIHLPSQRVFPLGPASIPAEWYSRVSSGLSPVDNHPPAPVGTRGGSSLADDLEEVHEICVTIV